MVCGLLWELHALDAFLCAGVVLVYLITAAVLQEAAQV